MEYQTPVEHINKVCDYLQTKGNILKRSGPYVRESDEETDEDETTYNTEFDPEKVAALKELFREQANQLTSPQYILVEPQCLKLCCRPHDQRRDGMRADTFRRRPTGPGTQTPERTRLDRSYSWRNPVIFAPFGSGERHGPRIGPNSSFAGNPPCSS